MDKITKAVIPIAGWGTRMLPVTKAVPKELIPIINVPTLQHIVQEALDSGIKEFLIIISNNKKVIKKYFARNGRLEKLLVKQNKPELLKTVKAINKIVKIKYAYQNVQLGLGHAISLARGFANNKPFAVLLGDDIVVSKKKPALAQCIETYNKTGCSVIGVQEVAPRQVSKYGIVKPVNKRKIRHKFFAINDMVEKPSMAKAPSNQAILGRYILTPDIFDAIKQTPRDKSGEIQLTNALKTLLKNQKHMYACNFDGTWYDCGNKLGMVKATIDFAIEDPELRKDIIKFFREKNNDYRVQLIKSRIVKAFRRS